MTNLKKKICTFGLIIGMSSMSTLSAFAATSSEVSNKLSKISNVKVDDSSGNLTLNGKSAGTVSTKEADGLAGITVNGKTYFVTEDTLNSIDSVADSVISSAEAKANDKSASGVSSQLNDIVAAYDIKADTQGAASTLVGFRRGLSTAAGILLLILMGVVSLITVLDLSYLGIPFIRGFLDGKGAENGSTTKDGATKARWVSDEAAYAVKQSTTGETYKSPIAIYIGKRFAFVLVLGVAVVLLATGNIALIMQVALYLTSGFIDTVTGMFAAG